MKLKLSSLAQNPVSPLSDPRPYQILILSLLALWARFALGAPLHGVRVLVIILGCLAFQAIASALVSVRFDPRSALISSLSLLLLARADQIGWLLLAGAVAIFSKFLLRARGKHIWNPTNLGIAVLAPTGVLWITPGQWGSVAWLAFGIACLGMVVVRRAERSDVTWAFLVAWTSIVFLRTLWLGDPWPIAIHELKNGALLIFAFFMISDPKTCPDTRLGRVLFAFAVAGLAGVLQFGAYVVGAPIYALVLLCPLVPVLDWLIPGQRYEWKQPEALCELQRGLAH